jgi:hypothetical protein
VATWRPLSACDDLGSRSPAKGRQPTPQAAGRFRGSDVKPDALLPFLRKLTFGQEVPVKGRCERVALPRRARLALCKRAASAGRTDENPLVLLSSGGKRRLPVRTHEEEQ